MFKRIFQAGLGSSISSPSYLLDRTIALLTNPQKLRRAFHIGERHYDISHRLFEQMLDKRMIYSCGYWKTADNLDDAQEAKLKLVFDKLMLKPGMRILDIGCGRGGAACYAAEHYDVSVTGITVSEQQAHYARHNCRDLPVEIRLQDYRKLDTGYDRIYSIDMFEHVGYKNHKTCLKTIRRCLKPDGLSLLHTIGGNTTRHLTDPWIDRYIFPNSLISSARQITTASEGLFVIEDWQNLGPDYARTLLSWYENFNSHWRQLEKACDRRFYRMWKYYLLSCAGAFLARSLQTWQVVMSPHGNTQTYHSPR